MSQSKKSKKEISIIVVVLHIRFGTACSYNVIQLNSRPKVYRFNTRGHSHLQGCTMEWNKKSLNNSRSLCANEGFPHRHHGNKVFGHPITCFNHRPLRDYLFRQPHAYFYKWLASFQVMRSVGPCKKSPVSRIYLNFYWDKIPHRKCC